MKPEENEKQMMKKACQKEYEKGTKNPPPTITLVKSQLVENNNKEICIKFNKIKNCVFIVFNGPFQLIF